MVDRKMSPTPKKFHIPILRNYEYVRLPGKGELGLKMESADRKIRRFYWTMGGSKCNHQAFKAGRDKGREALDTEI